MSRMQRIGVVVSACIVLALAGTVRAQPPSPAAAPAAAKGAGLTGQRISLDLKGVDILDVLKLLSQKSGLNFVAGRNVSGRVTIFVNDVDVWEAFELIIGANDLAYERRGDIITVMMARDYELIFGEKFQERKESFIQPLRYAKVVQVSTVLNQLKSAVGRVVADEATNTLIVSDVPTRLKEMKALLIQLDRPTESRVYNLNYAQADKFKEKVQDLLSPVGMFTFDARTNKVIISDLREVLQKTDQVVHAFDTPEGQVLIEAKIISVKLTDEMNLGIDWQRVLGGVDTAIRNNFDSVSGDIIGGTATGGAIKLLTANANATVVIEALKSVGKLDTISNPRIMVSNNQEAKILVGSKEAFVTTTTTIPTAGPTVSAPQVQFVDVGIKLFVTPNVKNDGFIQLKIRPEVSTTDKPITSIPNTIIPIVKTTEAETNVLVKSGVTLIIAGLIESKNDRTDNRVPWLGNVPILGSPFRGLQQKKEKSELVIFLTPQIVMPDGSAYVPPPAQATLAAGDTLANAAMPEVILQDPVPALYRHMVRQRLQSYLASQFRAAELKQGSVVVSFVLNQDGQLLGEGIVTSPQGEPFIKAAKEALQQAQPFPPFPEGSQTDEVRFRIAVEYQP